MARLSIGVDVAGVTQVEKLSNAISSLALVTDNYQKVSLKSSGGSQQMVKAAQDLDHAYAKLGAEATKTYAILQNVMKGPKFDGQSKVMAQVKAYSQLVAVGESYSAALAKQIILEDKTAQAVVKKTAAIVAQNKAVEALALKGIASSAAEAPSKLRALTGQSDLRQGNYAAEVLLENKSIEAQARGLTELQAQMSKLNATRAGLKQGNYAAEILRETASIEAQARGLAELQAQMSKLNATRAGLKQGNYAAEILRETASIEAQARGLTELQAQMSKLNATRAGLKQGNYAAEILRETASIEAQARGLTELQAQMSKLNATRAGLKQGNYAAEILRETASIEAQARGLAELQAQMSKLNATRAGLKQGNYAAEILLENKAIEAQARGLAELQAQMGKLNATRAGLKQGNYASQMRTESIRSGLGQGSNAAQIASESGLYDDNGKLKYAINNMKDYEAAMKRAASEATDFAATTGKGNSALNTLGAAFDKTTGKGRTFHDMLRGASGAAGSLWMTYGQMAPLLAGFAAVGGTMATITKGADLDYTARSIELLAYGFETLDKNSALATASLEGTKQVILGIADTPFTAGELGKGILELSRAGYTDLAANLKNIDQASKFAYIGQMDLAQAVELVVGQMSAFKEIGKDASPALNTMAVVADKTSISLQQMAEAFKNTTSLGTVMGLRFDDIAVALGVMGQAGIRGATAGAALNTMMYKLVAPTEMAQKKMRALGIEFDAFDAKTGQMKSIKTIAFELANMTKGLDTKQISGVFESMVGLRGVKALGALVQMARSSSDEFDKLSNAVKNSGGYLDGYMKILDKSGKVQIDKLKSDFDRLFTANYDNAGVVSALKGLRDVVNDKATTAALASITTGIITVVGAMAKLIALDPTAFAAGAGVVGMIVGTNPVVATAVTAAAGLKLVDDQITKIRENITGSKQTSSALNPFAAWTEYTDSVKVLFDNSKKGIDSVKTSAADAKKVLADLAGVQIALPDDAKAGDLEKLQAVGDYFDSIQNKILDMNRTPLQIVDAQVTRDAANMLAQLSSGGLKLDDMIAVAKGYTQSIEDLGNEGSSSAKKIEAISESFAKTGAPKAKIKELQDLLKGLATSLNKKEIEKANKEMLVGMRKEWQSYADKVIELQDKIAGTQRTLAEELRAIDQSNMGGMSLWKDKQKEAKEYAATAKKAGQDALAAFATGDSVTGQKQFALAEEYFKKAAEAAKALNTEVKGSNQALDLQIDKAQSVLNVLKAQQEAYSARGQKSGPLDAQIANAEAALKVLEARKAATDSQILITKPQGAEEAKAIMQDLYNQQVKLQQAVQDSYKMQMESIQKKADTQMGGPVDMTQGMDDAKARWIQSILTVKEEAVKLAPEITGQLATINMPTENWKASIFNMKGMFVQAVDEMAVKLNSEFSNEKTVTRFSNAVPTKEYVDAINALNGVKVDPVSAETVSKVDGMKQNAEAFGTALQTAGDYVANSLVGNLLNVGTAITNNMDMLKGMNVDGVEEFMEKTKTSLTSLGAGIADIKLGDSLREAFTDTYEDMTKTNSAFIDSMGEGWKVTGSLAIDQIDSIYGSLKDLVNKDWTVKVRVEEARALGGMLGGYHNGGMIQALASGGGVKNVLQGAYLPGFGGGDRRLLYGEDGEVMINKFAVAKATPQTALAFNRGDFGTVVDNLLTRFPHLLGGYAAGGMVSESATTSSPTGPQAAGYSSSFTFTDTTGQQGRVFGTEPDIKLLERAINKHNRFRSSNR